MIDFKGAHYPKDVTLYVVFFYVHYAAFWSTNETSIKVKGEWIYLYRAIEMAHMI